MSNAKRRFSDEDRLNGLVKSLAQSEWGQHKTVKELKEKAQGIIEILDDLNNR